MRGRSRRRARKKQPTAAGAGKAAHRGVVGARVRRGRGGGGHQEAVHLAATAQAAKAVTPGHGKRCRRRRAAAGKGVCRSNRSGGAVSGRRGLPQVGNALAKEGLHGGHDSHGRRAGGEALLGVGGQDESAARNNSALGGAARSPVIVRDGSFVALAPSGAIEKSEPSFAAGLVEEARRGRVADGLRVGTVGNSLAPRGVVERVIAPEIVAQDRSKRQS